MTTLQEIALAKLKLHPRNPRGDVGDVTELAASIKEKGVIEPLIVAPNTPSDYVLIAGHRRLAAATVAKVKTVPCIVREDLAGDAAGQLETMLVENLQRTDLTPIEEAGAYQQLLEYPGYTIKKITATTGRSASTVKGRLSLAKLPEKARTAVHTGQVTLADAMAVTEFAVDKAATAVLTKALGTRDFPYELQRVKDRRDRERARAKSAKQLAVELADGKIAQVLDEPPAHGSGVLRTLGDPGHQHTECGALAGWVNHRGDIEYGCTEPHTCEANRTAAARERTLGPSEPATAEPDREARRAAEQQLHDDLRSAATVRRKHLCGFIVDGTRDPAAHEILLRLTAYAASTVTVFACELLELDHDADAEVKARITTALSHLNVYQLAITLDVLLNANLDGDLERPAGYGAGGYGDPAKTWRHRLATTYGYEWSQVELDQLAKNPDAQTPPTEEQTDEADGYEHSDLRDAVDEYEDVD